MPQQKFDTIIIGGGLAGLTLALLLDRAGIKTAVVERTALATQTRRNFDVRTTALSAGSVAALNRARVWGDLAARACPITTIEILDGPRRFGSWAPPLTFNHDAPMGYIVDNQDLRMVLSAAIEQASHVTVLAPAEVDAIETNDDRAQVTLADGRVLTAPLLVGADGRGSLVREYARITTRGWPYRHTAVVSTITHEHPHQNIAIEHFMPSGPFAVLPFTDDAQGRPRSAVVWSERPGTARQIMAMDDATFIQALETRLPGRYGRVLSGGTRAAYPLTLQHATDYVGTRIALVADAAHGIHPIAGQGLNLGLQDVVALADLVAGRKRGGDVGAPEFLAAYQRARRAEVVSMVAATDLLTFLFGSTLPGVRGARGLGLRMVAALPPLKRFFIRRAMGT